MNHQLYSFGGYDSGFLCSLERIDCRRVVGGEAAQWETLDLTANAANPPIQPRCQAIMAPIGPSSILIAGGYGGSLLGDWFIVEPEKNTVKKELLNQDSSDERMHNHSEHSNDDYDGEDSNSYNYAPGEQIFKIEKVSRSSK